MAAPSAASAAGRKVVGISLGGKMFFGGLTAGTFGLGCWQVQRYNQKIDLIAERNGELAMEPTTDWESPQAPYRRKLLEGRLLHNKEVLIGPRGAPIGGPGTNTGGGMGPSPQGFMVLTPLQLIDGSLVWINRGWVPRAMVPGANRGGGTRPSHKPPAEGINQWDRPTGTVKVTAIRSKPEDPKMIAIEHDYSKRPLQLFWMDALALQAIAESDRETTLLTQVAPAQQDSTDEDQQQQRRHSASSDHQYPRLPALETIAEFKTTPSIHAGYAATWYGLSVAGVYMTRKLITRGRGG